MRDSFAPSLSVPRQSWNFVQHFLEMCIPMCVGVGLVGLALAGATTLGVADPRLEWPAPSLLAIALLLPVPMAAWMRFRAMPWRPILEMSVAGIAVALAAAAGGIISVNPVAAGEVCGVECVGMVAAMLVRLDLYTGRAGHHAMHRAQV